MATTKQTRVIVLGSTDPDSGMWEKTNRSDYPEGLITFLNTPADVASVINDKIFAITDPPTVWYFIEKLNKADSLLTSTLSKESYGIPVV